MHSYLYFLHILAVKKSHDHGKQPLAHGVIMIRG